MRVSVIVDIPGFNGPREVYKKEVQVGHYGEAEEAIRHAAGDIRAKDVWVKKAQQEEEEETE